MGFNFNFGVSDLTGSKGLGEAKRAQKWTQQNMVLGNSLDMDNQKEMYDYRISQGLEHGMTPYEMFSGPASGGGGGTSGSGGVLGNSASQLGKQIMQNKQQRNQAVAQISADLYKTKMQTDAQKEVAKIQTGSQQNIAEMQTETQKLIAENQLKFNKNTYNNVTLPEAAARIGKTTAETDKILNEVVTTKPAFVKYMKMLTMGVDNTLSAYIQNIEGYNLTDPESVNKIPMSKRKEILSMLLAIQSGTLKNVEGIKQFGTDFLDTIRNKPKPLGNGRTKGFNDITRHQINNAG